MIRIEKTDVFGWDAAIRGLRNPMNSWDNMYHSRKNHKLDEWRNFCEWVEYLPYAKELICDAP